MDRCETAHGESGDEAACRFTVTIFLMRAFMDHVVFADGGREVQMRKRKALER